MRHSSPSSYFFETIIFTNVWIISDMFLTVEEEELDNNGKLSDEQLIYFWRKNWWDELLSGLLNLMW